MHIKFLARGTGSARDAADYLLGARDATGQPRERGGDAHVHVLATRCDLETGRSLNIAPPGWQNLKLGAP